jgi:hypothetical protein
MGITYDPRTHRLLIVDSEVDEMPSLWKGSNFFVVRRKGNLVAARTFKKFTVEPCDVALATGDRGLYIADDDLDRVFRDEAGKDGLFGTRDDVAATVLRTRRFGSFDPEDLAWVPRARMLIVTDGADAAQTARVYTIRQGKDHRFGRASSSRPRWEAGSCGRSISPPRASRRPQASRSRPAPTAPRAAYTSPIAGSTTTSTRTRTMGSSSS